MPNLGPIELVLILAVIVIIFGVGRLPEVGGALGRGIREFRRASKDDDKLESADMKAKAGEYTFANSALGSMGHLATESFKRRTGTSAELVNYRGTAPAITEGAIIGNVTLPKIPRPPAPRPAAASS